ncbi:MAG: OsmC family protein [Ignavibacteriota bacterium]|jgi:osmotically inducible protein OsmC|nr:MAG: OsmC family peroxiredoxin [Chlorobiota bacterium]MBE7475603.1 OsmC family protein [Ignavibacteriales bacterium]MBL1123087.1 OsmC family peroxiredoxin [Ignavibacteriota bacterium]MBV6419968.1 Peroxiredoxin OsmC [Ignavibacteriaceae bacterium]MCE7855700.1 OsmC family peroxiredoxin [Ignavibacteria bacterium CHB3]MEB2295903.1 OsmC family protein [Ignavibacteria bacterium]
MPIRKANAEWKGDLKGGKGSISTETKLLNNTPFDAGSRFESGTTTNPEEILGAAHAGCYSMALANSLSKEGFKVNSIKTDAKVHLEKLDSGFTITKIELDTLGDVDGIDAATFVKHAEQTKVGCPVSKALTGPKIVLSAKLK